MIVWDESKRMATLAKRELDFADLDEAFFLAATVVPAKNGRRKAIGELHGRVITVVFALLGSEAISIVSMRRASRKERSL